MVEYGLNIFTITAIPVNQFSVILATANYKTTKLDIEEVFTRFANKEVKTIST